MKKITIGGVEFTPTPLSFNILCDMEEAGAERSKWYKLDFNLLRAYLAACLKISAEQAGDLIEEHIVSGGDLNELRNAFRQAGDESGFFEHMRNRATAEKEPAKTE